MANNNVHIKVTTDADTSGIDKTRNSLDDLGNTSSRTLNAASALGSMLKTSAFAGVAAFGAATAAATVTGFGFNSAVEQAQAQIMAFTKDAGKTANILSYVKEEAAKTQFSFTDMASAAAGLIPASKMSGIALKDLIKEAEILAALNPSEGLVGAAFSLKEALSGDFVSIVERFNLPRQRLNQLKDEGVPALEAIQIALREMGIDYSLVAAQGQTTAARWDQIKDKFTIMAGELSKPVFDKVSIALDRIASSVDFDALGDRLSTFTATGMQKLATFTKGIVLMFQSFKESDNLSEAPGFMNTMGRIGEMIGKGTDAVKLFFASFREGDNLAQAPGIMNTVGEVAEGMRMLWDRVYSTLTPSLKALWNTILVDLLPSLRQLWNLVEPVLLPALKILGTVIGVTLVAAVWLLINQWNIMIDCISRVINWIADNKNAVLGLATTFGILATAMGLQAVFAAIGAGFATLTTVTIPAVMLRIAALQALIAAPLVMPAIAVGAAVAALLSVRQAANDAADAVNNAKIAAANLSTSQQAARRQLENLSRNGSAEQKARANKALASGLYDGFSEGGYTGRGAKNEVAGIVHKGEYVVPKSQVDQSTGKPKVMGPQGTTIYQTNHIYNDVDLDQANKNLGWRLAVL